jgi:cytochrome P450
MVTGHETGTTVVLPTVRIAPLDPPPELGQLRETRPVTRLQYPDGHRGWLVTNYQVARAILADRRFAVHPIRPAVGNPAKAIENTGSDATAQAGNLLVSDPPVHTYLRRAVAGQFTIRRVAERSEFVSETVATLLDQMLTGGEPADLVESFSLPLPSLVLCELLGVPPSDRRRFEEPTDIRLNPNSTIEELAAARINFLDYVRGVIEHKRASPADDVLSDLARNETLTGNELAGMAMSLFIAGHETTAIMLASSVYALLTTPGRWDALRGDPSLVNSAVEELLRFLTVVPTIFATRTATADVDIADVHIAASESVTISLCAANRDPDRFPDPDRLDLERDAAGHLAFGQGIHTCIGQHLARLELQLGLRGLLERLPNLRLAVPAAKVPMHAPERNAYGVLRLPVEWS